MVNEELKMRYTTEYAVNLLDQNEDIDDIEMFTQFIPAMKRAKQLAAEGTHVVVEKWVAKGSRADGMVERKEIELWDSENTILKV